VEGGGREGKDAIKGSMRMSHCPLSSTTPKAGVILRFDEDRGRGKREGLQKRSF